MVAIPKPQAPFVDRAGTPTREWYTYLIQLRDSAGLTEQQQAQLTALAEAVKELQGTSGEFVIVGIGSVNTYGTPAGGAVQVTLENDTDSPGPTWYYGSGPDGVRGWFAISDTTVVLDGELTKVVDGDTGISTFGLADVINSGTGTAIYKQTIDAKGRVSGYVAATTDDLGEGTGNLYFTDERAQDAAGAALVGTGNVPLSYNAGTHKISAALSAAVLASLALADSALQAGDNVSALVNDAGYIGPAPSDGSIYGWKDGAWVVVTGGGGGGGTVTSVGTGTGLTGGPITGSGTISLSAASIASLALADSALQPGAAITSLAGTLPIGQGGTGATTATAARTALGLAIGTDVQAYSANLTGWAGLATSAKANSGAIGSSLLTMTTARLLGRTTAGTGAPEEITIGSNLTLSGGVLSATGGGSGSVTSVAVSGGTGLTVSGSPITTSGTITLALSANLQSWSGIAPSAKADTSALAGYVAKTGDTMSGTLTTPRTVLTNQGFSQLTFGSGTYSDVYLWGQAGAGDNVMSYTRAGSSNYAAKFFGSVEATQLKATAESILHFTFGSGAYSTVYAWGQSGAGDDMFNIQRIASSRYRLNWNGPVQIDGVYTYADSGLRVESNLRQVGGHYNYAANGSGWVRTPRIFVGGSDPGAAASDGDIWIP